MNQINKSMQCQVVVVGDAKVGKSAIIRQITQDKFSEAYTPTSFDKHHTDLLVDNQRMSFVIWDTSGSSAYDSVRSLSYAEADVFLVCYKVSDPSTLYNVKNKWMPEIRQYRSNAPVILCGCQSDLRNDSEVISSLGKRGRAPVTPEQALAICCDVGAANYVETSAMASEVSEAFEVAGLAYMKTLQRYSTNSSHHSTTSGDGGGGKSSSIKSTRFNTSSSKTSSNKLNISFDSTSAVAEFSTGQIAQPQHQIHELDDFFPMSSSPVQNRRSGGPQRGLVSIPISQRASFSANSSTSPQKKAAGLTRKTSFRSPVTVVNHCVNVQKTPTTPEQKLVSADPRLVIGGSNPGSITKPPQPAKAYESLKSQGSTGSTGSKTSTSSSTGALTQGQFLELEENVPNTEDPELLNKLSFVSPKAGVYRPVNNNGQPNSSMNSGKKDKDKCILM